MQQHPGKLFPLPAVLLIDFPRLRKEMPDRNEALKLVVTVQRRAAAPEAFSLKIVLFYQAAFQEINLCRDSCESLDV